MKHWITFLRFHNHKRKEEVFMNKKVLAAMSVVATLVATLVATSACIWWVYQPEEPESLKNL